MKENNSETLHTQLLLAHKMSKKLHAGQFDKSGVEYYKHPQKVSEIVEEVIVEILQNNIDTSFYFSNDETIKIKIKEELIIDLANYLNVLKSEIKSKYKIKFSKNCKVKKR